MAQNTSLLFLPEKNSTFLKEVCYKVFWCGNFQQHSCSYIISLSNGP